MWKTPREEERLGMNRGRAFKNKSPREEICFQHVLLIQTFFSKLHKGLLPRRKRQADNPIEKKSPRELKRHYIHTHCGSKYLVNIRNI